MTQKINADTRVPQQETAKNNAEWTLNTIVVASFMGSGSSAVTDLLREYDNVNCPNGSYEYVFLHCPNGLFDLEDKLLLNNNAIRSDEALRSFRDAMRELYSNKHWWFADYENTVGNGFMQFADQLISAISYRIDGFWYEHEKISQSRLRLLRVLKKLGWSSLSRLRRHNDTMLLSYPSDDEFFDAASKFVEKSLLGIANNERQKTLLTDQLLLPHNFYRKDNYFSRDRLKIILVIRDPRDVFILNKYYWAPAGVPIPYSQDVNLFCRQYRDVRTSVRSYDPSNVLQINFEDLVLDYRATLLAIEQFCSPWLGEHFECQKYLKPEVSARNICVYRDREEFMKEAAIIAEQLPEYLYEPVDFDFYQKSRTSAAF